MKKIKIVAVCGFCLFWALAMNAQSTSMTAMSRGELNQRVLDSFAQGATEATFRVNMEGSSPLILPNYFAVRRGGTTHGGKKDIVFGKLFAVSDSGIFLYRSAEASMFYVPYSTMDYIMKGRPLRKRIVGHWCTEIVGWSIFIASTSWDDSYIGGPTSLAAGAYLGFVAGGLEALFWTTVYGIRKQNPHILIEILGDPQKGSAFREQLKANSLEVWKKVDSVNFPSGE